LIRDFSRTEGRATPAWIEAEVASGQPEWDDETILLGDRDMSNTELTSPPIPLLVEGDRLTAAEFERRYHAMPGLKKAELIEGVVHMPSPVRWDVHALQHGDISGWLSAYRAATPGTRLGIDGTIRLDFSNVPQPDLALILLPSHGGRAKVSADGYLEGAPELVVEIAASSASYDTNAKLRVYQRNSILEYVVWRVEKQQVDWYVLRGKKYDRLPPSPTGLLCSETFPGLWLDTAALFADDFAGVLATLQRGIGDAAHAAFVTELQARVGKTP
jgi:Uma2 family endonuclease